MTSCGVFREKIATLISRSQEFRLDIRIGKIAEMLANYAE